MREPVECVFRFPQRECGIAFMDFCGVVAYDFLNKHRRDSGFMQKGGGCVAEGVEGAGVCVPGFVLGGAVLFFVAMSGKGGIAFDEAACVEDFSEFYGEGGSFARMEVFLGR